MAPGSNRAKAGEQATNFEAVCFRGTLAEVLREYPELGSPQGGEGNRANTGFVVLNGGFGNFEGNSLDLLWSWIEDLASLTELGAPVFFTCANDYADASGELRVMANLLGARFAVLPRENPFSFATTLLDEDATPGDHSRWSRGNALWYSVQGFDANRRSFRPSRERPLGPQKPLLCRCIAQDITDPQGLLLSSPLAWRTEILASPDRPAASHVSPIMMAGETSHRGKKSGDANGSDAVPSPTRGRAAEAKTERGGDRKGEGLCSSTAAPS